MSYLSHFSTKKALPILLERAKERFIEALRVAQPVPKKIKGIPRTFYSFTIYYCENFRKGKVSDQTYKCDLGRINKYLKPLFNETPLYKITSKECQDLINDLTSKGLGKTADEIYSLLSIIFKGAMNHNILTNVTVNTVIPTVPNQRMPISRFASFTI